MQPRRTWKIAAILLQLFAGLIWLYIGLRNFDRLDFLSVYRLPLSQSFGIHGGRSLYHIPQARGGFLLPCVAGLLFLIAAAVQWLSFRRSRENGEEPAVTTLFGPPPGSGPASQ